MSDPGSKRHIVIGAGIVGVHVARALQRRGFPVTLLDQGESGMSTSYGNAGFLATEAIFPLAHGRVLRALPRMLLDPLGPLSIRWQEFPRLLPWYARYVAACSSSRVSRSIAALAAIQRFAASSWRQFAEREAVTHLLRETGAWKLFETDQGFRATAAERSVQSEHGIRWELTPRAGLVERIPEIAPSVRHGVYYPDGISTVNSLALTSAIFDRFVADGGTFVQTRVVSLRRDGARISTLETTSGDQHADQIVIAAGHLSGRLLKPLAVRVPIVAERGYHVEMQHDEISFDMPVGAYERGFYMTPMTSGLRLAGTSEFSSADHDEPPNWARADILERHVRELLPGVTKTATGRWMGHRPSLPDFLPALGPVPGFDNLHAAFGHHHLGLTLSAITGEIMGELLSGGTPPIELSAFSLARFQ
jgi:glycine/D-amino acid oxidase-like deaminating enzyme